MKSYLHTAKCSSVEYGVRCVQEMIKKAFGGILLVDEAYYLYNAANDKDYGQESIEILLNVMEEQKDDLIVTLAGCEELRNFLIIHRLIAMKLSSKLHVGHVYGNKTCRANSLMLDFARRCVCFIHVLQIQGPYGSFLLTHPGHVQPCG